MLTYAVRRSTRKHASDIQYFPLSLIPESPISTDEQTKGVTILLCTESGFRIAKRLKIPILIRIQVQNHNTSIGVMILLFTGSESGSGIANKIKKLTLDPDPGPE